jgi:hypothetical protein
MDFDEIKARVPIMEVVGLLQIDMTEKNGGFRSSCPVCKGHQRQLAVTPKHNAWYCQGLGKGGDVTGLYAHVKGLRMGEAAEALKEAFGLEDSKPRKAEKKLFDHSAFKEKLLKEHELLAICDIDPEDAKAWGIGVNGGRGFGAGHILIPLYRDGNIDRWGYIDGELVVYKGAKE